MSEDEKKKRVKARLSRALLGKFDGVTGVGLPHGFVTVSIKDADVEPRVREELATIDLEGITVYFQVTGEIIAG